MFDQSPEDGSLYLSLSLSDTDKLVASAAAGGLQEKPRRQTHADVPRGPESRYDTRTNALLRVQPHRHDLQRAGKWPRQPSRQLQNPRGR